MAVVDIIDAVLLISSHSHLTSRQTFNITTTEVTGFRPAMAGRDYRTKCERPPSISLFREPRER